MPPCTIISTWTATSPAELFFADDAMPASQNGARWRLAEGLPDSRRPAISASSRFFFDNAPLPEHHKAKINEFEEKRDTIRARLAAKGENHTNREGARTKSEFEKDIENLMNAFERWVEHVEKEFDQAS